MSISQVLTHGALTNQVLTYQVSGDIWGNILWLVMMMFFFLFYPRLMITQMLWKLERSALMLENLTAKGKRVVIKRISKKPDKRLKHAISNFLEFFLIQPVSLDPYGIVKKFEHLVNLQEKRFKYFVKSVAPQLSSETQANVIMGLSAAISLNQIAKIVRHYVEMIRKTKNLQLAMVLQMQVPLIERIAKALYKGTEALSNGWPIGDCTGALIAAHMFGTAKPREIEEDTLLVRKRVKGKRVFLIKARGPGGRLGKPGKAVEKLIKRHRIAKIITIDAAAKLEGERTGSIAEGIGVAIGGVGVQRAHIENVAVKRNIPLDSVVIKMSQEEAIQPIKAEVLAAVPSVIKLVEESVAKTKGNVIVVGVGNSAGIGNSKADAERAEKRARQVLKIVKTREAREKKSKWQWLMGE